MSEIGESVIEAAWDEVTNLSETRVRVEMERLTREQPDLITFILSAADGIGERVGEFAGFVTFVVWKIFRSQTRGTLKRITSDAIQRKLEENEQALMSLDDSGEDDDAAIRKITPQPMVFAAVLAAMAAAEEEEEQPLVLNEDDKGELILLLKTAIDTLDDARKAAESKARLSS
jgi:hypothetical protein